MKKILFPSVIILFLFTKASFSQENFKVMFYNLLNYPNENTFPERDNDLELILNMYQPDLFLVCELNNNSGANSILNITKNSISNDMEMVTYQNNSSDDNSSNSNELQNLLYFNSSKFILEDEIIVQTDLRDFNIYKLKINSVNQAVNPVSFYVIVCHLKASTGSQNELRRFNMVLELDAFLNTLPSDALVLLGGDLNIYGANEPAFQQLLQDTNNITFTDPANRIGQWNNNPNFVDVFTQSTRTQSNLGGSSGGFDDRFDFILTSENMETNTNLYFVNGSYKVFGNNNLSSCYNKAINSSDCGSIDSEYDFIIRNALFRFSDHLPVILELETNETLLSTTENNFKPAFQILNPLANKNLNLEFSNTHFKNKNLLIFNQLGQQVLNFKIDSRKKQSFDVSFLGNGLYFVKVEGYSRPIKKVIIAND